MIDLNVDPIDVWRCSIPCPLLGDLKHNIEVTEGIVGGRWCAPSVAASCQRPRLKGSLIGHYILDLGAREDNNSGCCTSRISPQQCGAMMSQLHARDNNIRDSLCMLGTLHFQDSFIQIMCLLSCMVASMFILVIFSSWSLQFRSRPRMSKNKFKVCTCRNPYSFAIFSPANATLTECGIFYGLTNY